MRCFCDPNEPAMLGAGSLPPDIATSRSRSSEVDVRLRHLRPISAMADNYEGFRMTAHRDDADLNRGFLLWRLSDDGPGADRDLK
jgi:hypothetical protein